MQPWMMMNQQWIAWEITAITHGLKQVLILNRSWDYPNWPFCFFSQCLRKENATPNGPQYMVGLQDIESM